MKSKEEFEKFYNNELKRRIDDLEKRRVEITEKYSFKRYRRNLKWLVILIVLLGIARAVVPKFVPEEIGLIVFFTVLYAIIAAIYIYYKRSKHFKPLKVEYKQAIIPKIISFVDSNLKYNPEAGISQEEFRAGGIFRDFSRYRTEDLVQGQSGDMEIKMADIECTRTETTRSGNSSKSRTVTVFKGFYIISKLSGKIPSGVIIKPSIQIGEKMVGLARKFLGDKLVDGFVEKLGLNDIESGDVEFDKQYQIKTINPEVAKALLTPRFTQLILTFQKEVDVPVSLSLFDNNLHIAFGGVNMFETDVFTSFVEKDISKKYFNYLNLAYGIVEAIRANN